MRSARRKSLLKAAINHQPWDDCIRQRPERRSESRCRLVEFGITIELSRELEVAVDNA